MTQISVKVIGLDKLRQALQDVPDELERTVKGAGNEIGETILRTEGLREYPPATEANSPPTPYYIRGRGMQYKRGNNHSSERLRAQYYVETHGTDITIGNRASYAGWVSGEEQARAMGAKGWRKLLEVAEEKLPEITRIYNDWVERGLKKLGL
jgi:hypothetical protein